MSAVEGIRRLTKFGAIVAGLACASTGATMLATDVEKTPAEVRLCGSHGDFDGCGDAIRERHKRSAARGRFGLALILLGTPLAVALVRGAGWVAQGFVKEQDGATRAPPAP